MTNSIDQQFVEFVVKSLVGNPDAVVIERRIDEKGVLLELTVDPEDLGRVIGKRGATAQSLRTLLRALGTKNDARYNLKIIDNGEPREHDDHQDRQDNHEHDDQGSASSATPTNNDDQVAPQDDTTANSTLNDELGIDDERTAVSGASEDEDRLSKTRQELADLDDLDV
ncbi:MAG: KH domain-containing protein [Candidatus Saccharimonadales bacterium]